MTEPTEQPGVPILTADVDGKLLGEKELRALNEHINKQQPNTNAMIFEQVNGSIKVAMELLGQLIPKTSQVDGCVTTLKSWQDNNLKYLQKAFE